VFAAIGLVEGSYMIVHAGRAELPNACAGWDEAARHALAPLTHQQKISAPDRPLLDALAALRRARHNCATGRPDLARRDYEALFRIAGPGTSLLARD
jgi:hypothetical protein